MGWLKKLLGRPDAPGHGLDPTRPPPQKSPAGQPHHPDPPEQPVNPSWTATAPTLRPEDICVLSVRAIARMQCDGSWLESARTGS